MSETPVIEIRNLHKAYGALEVIKGVDLVAPRGHVIALIGSSARTSSMRHISLGADQGGLALRQ